MTGRATTVTADVAVVGGGRRAVQAALAVRGPLDDAQGLRVVLVADGPVTAGDADADVPVSSVLAATASAGHTWVFGYERARTTLRDATRPAVLRGIEVVAGDGARITGVDGARALVEVPSGGAGAAGGTRVRARRLLVVPPLVPTVPGIAGLPDVTSWRPEQVPSWEDVPGSLVVLGGGATGCELASAFSTWGSRVTVVERAERLLPAEHPAASAAVLRRLESAGVRVLLGGTVTRVAPTLDGGVYVGTDVGGDVAASHLVLATGRHPEPVLGAAALEAKLRRRRLPWRGPEVLRPADDVIPVVLATTPPVAHVGLPQAPEGGALTSTEVSVPDLDDARLVLVSIGDRLRGCTAVGDGADLAIAEAALALAAGVPLRRWAQVGRAVGTPWSRAFARALAAATRD